MTNFTLVMTRKPLAEVKFGKKNGRWGRMVLLKGGQVMSGTPTPDFLDLPDLFAAGPAFGLVGAVGNFAASMIGSIAEGKTPIRIGSQGFALTTFGGDVECVGRFDTLERFRTDSNAGQFYVQLKPRPDKPYTIKMDIAENVKQLNGTGQCFRVMDHSNKTSSGGKAGILIHEAPHPGWLIGCIGPRPVNNRVASHDKGPSRSAMEAIFRQMGGFSTGKQAQLLVMDW